MDAVYARNILARHIVAHAYHTSASWEDYPEVGEYDWLEVEAEVKAISNNFAPPHASVHAAILFLANRATPED